ncbi:MAG: tandem-95 repeat protein, partial [Arcobacter sp.]|uniref:tandem-95 repeat protein n=1 Tax=Arcobacter sp. TaxID=1872629 RepID=UPI002A74BBBD
NEDNIYENTIILDGNIEDVTYEILENTSNGSFTLNSDGTYSYVPNSNYSGMDIVTLLVTNKYGETATSTLTFDILEINDAPEIEVITEVVTKEDAVVITGQIEASDVDVNAVLTFSTTQVVAGFTLNSDGSYSFDSSVEEYQSLSQGDIKEIVIPVSVSDENNAVDTKDLVIKVEGTNDTPIATADVGSVEENGILTLSAIEVLSNDVDVDSNDVLTITKISAPTNKGNASLDDNGDVVFNTGKDFDYLAVGEVEEVVLNYEISDDKGASSSSTIIVTVTGINDAPEIEVITEVVTKEDAVVITGQIEASDVDVNAVLTFSTTQVVAGFTLNSDGSYSFDSSVEEYQSLSQGDIKEIVIPVSVSDENNAVDTKDLVIKVEGTNDTPIATADVGSVEENGILTLSAIEVLSNDVDVDSNDVLTITKISAPTNKGNASLDDNGDVVFNTGKDFDYLAVGEVEEVVLNYEISDDKGASSSSTIIVTVTGTNDVPVITNPYEKSILRQEIVKEGKIEVLDIDGDVLTFSVLEIPKHGELVVDQEGNWIYNIDTTYKGLDFAKILINDGNGGEVVKTINFDIQNKPINGNNWSNYIFSSYNEKDIINGLGGNDYIYVINNKDNMIFAGDGRDTINAGSGNELLDGGSGDDRIYSSYGDDLIIGNTGNDYLEGSYGNDTYIFNLGDGHDTIYDYEGSYEVSNDKIVLSGVINLEDINFIRIDNDLLISIDENNSINIQNWYAHSDSYKIEKIELTDSGLILGIEEIESFSKIVGYRPTKGFFFQQYLN